MKLAARLGDRFILPESEPLTGESIEGSSNVLINNTPAMRVGDIGVHVSGRVRIAWHANTGSETTLINNRSVHRLGDDIVHAGGVGKTVQGSANVIVGGRSTRSHGTSQMAASVLRLNHQLNIRLTSHDLSMPVTDRRIRLVSKRSVIETVTDETGSLTLTELEPQVFDIYLDDDFHT